MKRTTILLVVGAVIVGALLWWSSAHAPGSADRAEVERELKDEGVMDEDGTIAADAEFDAELNAMTRELNAADSEGGAELDAIEVIQ